MISSQYLYTGAEIGLNSSVYEVIEGGDVSISVEILNNISLARELEVFITIDPAINGERAVSRLVSVMVVQIHVMVSVFMMNSIPNPFPSPICLSLTGTRKNSKTFILSMFRICSSICTHLPC